MSSSPLKQRGTLGLRVSWVINEPPKADIVECDRHLYRVRNGHGLTCHPTRRSPLPVSLEIRRRKRSGWLPCVRSSLLVCSHAGVCAQLIGFTKRTKKRVWRKAAPADGQVLLPSLSV